MGALVARGQGQWDVGVLALLGLGNLYRQRGNLPPARRYYTVSFKIARRFGLRTLEGYALHDLMGLSFDFGDAALGLEYARRAVEAFGPGHSRLHILARDLAWVWMDHFGEFANAALLLDGLLNHVWDPPNRLLLLANLARASAGAGWRMQYEQMWNETWALMRQQPVQAGHAGALIQLAYGAAMLAQWERAEVAASEALMVAQARKEGEMVIVADSVLEAARSEARGMRNQRVAFRVEVRPELAGLADELSSLTDEVLSIIRTRRDDEPIGPARVLLRPG